MNKVQTCSNMAKVDIAQKTNFRGAHFKDFCQSHSLHVNIYHNVLLILIYHYLIFSATM